MKYKTLCTCAVFVFAVAATPAQMKHTFSGKCAKPDVMQSVPAGDKADHVFMIQSGKCVAIGEMGGAKAKEGVFSEHDEAMGNNSKAWGVYVETYDSGDKIFYNYQSTGTMKDNNLVSGGNRFQITGGTGKMKGIKGSGTCTTKGTPDGGLEYNCTGDVTLPMAAPAK
jgi:hypothetical protein